MSRIAVIQKEKCNPLGCGNFLCIRVCPVNKMGKECIVEEGKKPKINEELCTGCGICQNRCPFEAISIINLPSELDKPPIHLYGKNGFHLYSLPTPIFGKVVGIVGVNGIGKSTAIKILAGVLEPNLGKLDNKEVDYKELIDYFKGTEAQVFFEKVKNKQIKISYKPQHVDLIPKQIKGKVKDLLKKVDEKKEMGRVVKELEIENILDNDVTKISGGELQRVAIAATVLKKANLYIFDEPSSYLDIKQRLKIAQFIKSLVRDDVSIVVIEHDLIVMDYMADLIHIMYGKEGCYGVVSQLKAAKAGINSYLDGFIREDNIRFRDHKIKFEVKPPVKRGKENVLTSWDVMSKKMGKFKLETTEGNIQRNETVGIIGENGIGKTSFVKLLAGVEKPDKGEIDEKIVVSYKPQQLEADSDELVMSVLHDAIKSHTKDLINPLNIKSLYMKKLSQLSGGELQRVAIALALSKKCDLYLLDEPSAYLDVEQRLIISKIIRNVAEITGRSILVVDHDLLFIDYLSDRLIVFEGEPAVHGVEKGPFSMEDGMNSLLTDVAITLRRDEESGRPRINKPSSIKDREQKEKNKYYYG
ncbi:MAG: ribosome biogenesis/translation initiation ATPase RLI [Nanoarchaeota archaeon]|nr:ribosome biogenesis/translation initiation ATPase RLI [Nanoarchaeota archaeon]MBU1005625.1 ribosome biogenesis/translation initiation ATPase RLI [Nanoarchaeota archaeon]MBU1946355.1 ribosome biogenesis/translation initiation ATPase RLI [Nanoarchaeota archaeon]